jgi:putative ATP-binding cassette transporter
VTLLQFLFNRSRNLVLVSMGAGIVAGLSTAAFVAIVTTVLANAAHLRHPLWIYVTVALLILGARFASHWSLSHLAQDTMLRLRVDLTSRILNTPLKTLEDVGPHRLMSALSEDVMIVAGSVHAVPIVILNASIVAGSYAYLLWKAPLLAVIVLVFLLTGAAGYYRMIRFAMTLLEKARGHADSLYAHFRALTTGIKELKLSEKRRQVFLMEWLRPAAERYRNYSIRGETIYSAGGVWSQAMFLWFFAFLLFAAPQFRVASSQDIVICGVLVLYLAAPIDSILFFLPAIGRANVAVANIENIGLALPACGLPATNSANASPVVGGSARIEEVELDQIAFSYRNGEGEFRLGPLSLSIRPGEITFVSGGNGSGKSTLAKIILGLYEPAAGRLIANGQVIDAKSRPWYVEQFGAVFTDCFVFEGLLLTDPTGVFDAAARRWLSDLDLANSVTIQNGRFSTTQLSQGQRKRLALLGALLEDRTIYIFDEWAAEQDPNFRRWFYLELLPLLKRRGKGTVVISHDTDFEHVADRVLILNFGKLEETNSNRANGADLTLHGR